MMIYAVIETLEGRTDSSFQGSRLGVGWCCMVCCMVGVARSSVCVRVIRVYIHIV